MKREATVNRKGEMTDGRKSGRIESERCSSEGKRNDERVSTRPREGEKPSTLHICSIIHHIPRSVAHTHTAPTRAPTRRGNLSHVCKQERQRQKTT